MKTPKKDFFTGGVITFILISSILTGCDSKKRSDPQKPVESGAAEIKKASPRVSVSMDDVKAPKQRTKKPPTESISEPRPTSVSTEPKLTFHHQLQRSPKSGPGKDLEERAHLLMNAFQPGLDDLLDPAGKTLFEQLLPDAPKTETISYRSQADLWGIDPVTPIQHAQRTGNLAFLNIAIHHADNLICVLNDPETGRTVLSTGKKEPVWPATDKNEPLEGPIPRIAHLSTGAVGAKMTRVINFILSHPELHNKKAPAPLHPEELPSHIQNLGETYLDRALVYLNALEFICDFFIREGSYWEFDTTDPENIHGWWFNNSIGEYKKRQKVKDTNHLEKMATARKKFPNGIQFSAQAFESLGVSARPVNRALILNSMFAGVAHNLNLLDQLNGEITHQQKIEAYNRIVRHGNNTFRSLSFDMDEGSFLGTSRIFQYGPNKFVKFKDYKEAWYVEDATHLMMDFGALQYMIEISESHPGNPSFSYLPEKDIAPLVGTLFSRFFDLKANIVCARIYAHPSDKTAERTRHINMDKNGKPQAHGDYMVNTDCPMFGDWIGRYSTTVQQLAINAKIQEMADERFRRMEEDSGLAGFVLQRPSTWPDYRFAYPFQLKLLRETRAMYGVHTARHNAHEPSCSFPRSVKVQTTMPYDETITILKASDADTGQQVTYWIIGGNRGLHLELDPFTGELTRNKYYPIENTDTEAWKLKVMVADDGFPVRYTIGEIAIKLAP